MVLRLVSFPPLSVPSLLLFEGGGPVRVGQIYELLGWESGAPLGQLTSSSRLSCWELRPFLGGYRCAGRNMALDPRQGVLTASLFRVLVPLCFQLLLVDAERVECTGH